MKAKVKTLEPIIIKDSWSSELESLLINLIIEAIFKPIVSEISDIERMDNDRKTTLEKALKSGRVQYQNGQFRGEITTAISKEIKSLGGRFYRGSWHIPPDRMPEALTKAISSNQLSMRLIEANINKVMDVMPSILTKKISMLDLTEMGIEGLDRVSKEFKRTVGEAISIAPDIGVKGRKEVRDRYFESENLPIKKHLLRDFEDKTKYYSENFSQETVEKLRKKISDHIATGGTRKDLRKLIGSELDIAKDRARFIARQETSLLLSNFKEVQYKQAGIDKYIWRTVGDNRVREKHAELNGKIFSFDSPPDASYFNTGQPENPSHDYNCRCVAIPIVEF
jgi:SPP1 gp7 family putative phage head morphogenesis protein